MVWSEQDHPRDDEGKFTYKDGGTLKGGIEKTEGGGKFSDLFNGFNLGEIKDVLLGVITTAVPMALKAGMSIFELKNIIETNNLEKELKEEIKRERIRKDIKKEEKERIKRDRLAKLTEKEQTVLSSNSRKSSSISNSISSLRSRGNTSKENPKDILYSESSIQRQQKLKDDEYKNKLLDILGDRATHADVLYGTPKELEEKVREYGLQNKLKGALNNKKSNSGNDEIKKSIDARDMYERNIRLEKKIPNQIINSGQQLLAEIGISNYSSFIHDNVKKIFGPDAAGMLDLSSGNKNDSSYIKDTIELKNFNDPRIASDKKYFVEKLYLQFQNEYTQITNIHDIKGYFFKNYSEPSKRIAANSDFRKTIKENKNKILKGEKITMEFPNYGYNQKSNLHYALGHIDIRNGYIDKEGNLRIKVYDTYDFNKTNPTPANQAGRNQMLRGNLKPYFTIHDIIIPKKDINELWK